MPTFHFIDSLGKEIQIIPEAISRAVPGVIHCVPIDNSKVLLSIHQDCIITRYTQEEILKAKQKQLENLSPI